MNMLIVPASSLTSSEILSVNCTVVNDKMALKRCLESEIVTFVIDRWSFFRSRSQTLPGGHQVYFTQGYCHESAGQVVQQLQRPWRSQHAPGVEPVCHVPNDNDGLQHRTADVDTQRECLSLLWPLCHVFRYLGLIWNLNKLKLYMRFT